MKKSVFPAALLLIAIGISGCPVYDDDAGCYDDYDCEHGYRCDRAGFCYADDDDEGDGDDVACRAPDDCRSNETCSRFGTCSSGDCHYSSVGCVKGYVCTLDAGRYTCVARSSNGGAGGAESGTGGASGAGGQEEPSPSAGAGG